jgi:hypothetical protein
MAQPASAKATFEAGFISEIFHSLSQPLTAIHCTLELALDRDKTFEQLRKSVESALESTERLRQRLLLLRALNDATLPCQTSEATDFGALISELADEAAPLFESAGRILHLEVQPVPLHVLADKAHLLRGLFVFLEYLLHYLPESGMVSLELCVHRYLAELRIESTSCLPVAPGSEPSAEPHSCEIELARRTFMAAGGRFTFVAGDSARSIWIGELPLVEGNVVRRSSARKSPAKVLQV